MTRAVREMGWQLQALRLISMKIG
ncbi:protein of unknown function [Rhodovastum atsumiense]|nr:protein of unknown function [Rhodovastum atsumiense]